MNKQLLRTIFVILCGLIAGVVGDSSRWIFGTGEMVSLLPWHRNVEWVAPNLTMYIIHLVLGVAMAWVTYAVPMRRAWFVWVAGVLLCFTASAALSLHKITVDPFPPAVSQFLGGLVGWSLARRKQATTFDVAPLFEGQLSPDAIRDLETCLTSEDLVCENRPMTVLSCSIVQPAQMRKLLGPSEFLAFHGEFRQRTSNLLLARRALVLPSAGEIVQACFGLPRAGANDHHQAEESAKLLLESLQECFINYAGPPMEFCVSVIQGMAATGIVNGTYQVASEAFDQGRQECEQARLSTPTTVPAEFTPTPKQPTSVAEQSELALDLEPPKPLPPIPKPPRKAKSLAEESKPANPTRVIPRKNKKKHRK